MSNDLTTANNTALATAFNYGEDAGAGFEGTKSSDLSIPFISVLQAISPAVEDQDPAGAAAGMLMNTVTKELYASEKGFVFIPCHKTQAHVEWKPRKDGGGFVASHESNSQIVTEAIARNGGKRNGLSTEAGNDLDETHYVFGLILDEAGKETEGFAVLSFTSSKIKVQRDWFTSMYTVKGKPPMFAFRSKIKTVKQKNDQGTFYNFKIEPFGLSWKESLINPIEESALLTEAKNFRTMAMSGAAKADYSQQSTEATVDENGIPF